MATKKLLIVMTAPLLLVSFQPAAASTEAADFGAGKWQENALLHPGKYTLSREARGLVTIYDGLTEAEVNKFMDTQFNRIQYVMFTRMKSKKAPVAADKNLSGALRKDNAGQDITDADDDGC